MKPDFEYLLFVLMAPVAAIVTLATIAALWPYRRQRLSRSLMGYLLSVTLLLLSNTGELLAPNELLTTYLAMTNHLFYSLTGVAWLTFSLAYARLDRVIDDRRYVLLLLYPLFTVIGAFSNPFHHLFYRDLNFFTAGGFLTFRAVHGPWFWGYGSIFYALLIVGTILIASAWPRRRKLYRAQGSLVTLGALLPLTANLSYVFDLAPGVDKDFTSLATALAGIFFFVGVHRYSLGRAQPIPASMVLEDVESAVLVADPEGTIIDANSQIETIAGVPVDNLLGTHLQDKGVIAELLKGLPWSERGNRELSLSVANETRSFEVWVRPVEQGTGRLIATVFTIADITERARLLEERGRALRQVAERETRVNQLQLQLLRQERLAILGQLSAEMAHELNNPLTFVSSGVRYLLSELERLLNGHAAAAIGAEEVARITGEVAEVRDDVEHGLARMGSVVGSLLSYARRGVGSELQQAELNEIVETTLHIAGPTLSPVATVDSNLGELPSIECRPQEISQVLLNLLVNSAQAMRQHQDQGASRRGTVSIRTGTREDQVFCEICDTGPGVPPEVMDRLFEPFFSTKREDEGTGLGLAIARRIVQERHGGAIYLKPDNHNCFVVELPIHQT